MDISFTVTTSAEEKDAYALIMSVVDGTTTTKYNMVRSQKQLTAALLGIARLVPHAMDAPTSEEVSRLSVNDDPNDDSNLSKSSTSTAQNFEALFGGVKWSKFPTQCLPVLVDLINESPVASTVSSNNTGSDFDSTAATMASLTFRINQLESDWKSAMEAIKLLQEQYQDVVSFNSNRVSNNGSSQPDSTNSSNHMEDLTYSSTTSVSRLNSRDDPSERNHGGTVTGSSVQSSVGISVGVAEAGRLHQGQQVHQHRDYIGSPSSSGTNDSNNVPNTTSTSSNSNKNNNSNGAELPSCSFLHKDCYAPGSTKFSRELSEQYDAAVEAQVVQLMQPSAAQLLYRSSVTALLTKHIRACLNCETYEIGLHALRCFLPDDPLRVTAVLCRNHSTKWHRTLCDKLTTASRMTPEEAQLLLASPAYGGGGGVGDPMSMGGGGTAVDSPDMLLGNSTEVHGLHSLRNVVIANSKVHVQVQCSVDELDVETTCNARADICMLALLEEISALVGQNGLFKRSLLLIRAWWSYETTSYVGTTIRHYLSDFALSVMVASVFNQFHTHIHSPLQALCAFLAEFADYDGCTSAISLQGIVDFKSASSNTPCVRPPQSHHLLSADVLDRFALMYSPLDPSNPENDQLQVYSMNSDDSRGSDEKSTSGSGSGESPTAAGRVSGAAATAKATLSSSDSGDSPVHNRKVASSIPTTDPNHKALLVHRQMCSRNLSKFERGGYNVIDPFNCTNMVLERPSQNRIIRLAKVFEIGATHMAAFLNQSPPGGGGGGGGGEASQADEAPGRSDNRAGAGDGAAVGRLSKEQLNNLVESIFPVIHSTFRDSATRTDMFRPENTKLSPHYLSELATVKVGMSSGAHTVATGPTTIQHKLLRQMYYCNLMIESIIARTAVLDLVLEILVQKGPLPIGEVGKALAELTCIAGLSLKLKETYGGLKKFLEEYKEIVIIGTDHPFNPHVVLRRSLSVENLRLVDSGVFPTHAVIKMKKTTATSLRRNGASAGNVAGQVGAPTNTKSNSSGNIANSINGNVGQPGGMRGPNTGGIDLPQHNPHHSHQQPQQQHNGLAPSYHSSGGQHYPSQSGSGGRQYHNLTQHSSSHYGGYQQQQHSQQQHGQQQHQHQQSWSSHQNQQHHQQHHHYQQQQQYGSMRGAPSHSMYSHQGGGGGGGGGGGSTSFNATHNTTAAPMRRPSGSSVGSGGSLHEIDPYAYSNNHNSNHSNNVNMNRGRSPAPGGFLHQQQQQQHPHRQQHQQQHQQQMDGEDWGSVPIGQSSLVSDADSSSRGGGWNNSQHNSSNNLLGGAGSRDRSPVVPPLSGSLLLNNIASLPGSVVNGNNGGNYNNNASGSNTLSHSRSSSGGLLGELVAGSAGAGGDYGFANLSREGSGMDFDFMRSGGGGGPGAGGASGMSQRSNEVGGGGGSPGNGQPQLSSLLLGPPGGSVNSLMDDKQRPGDYAGTPTGTGRTSLMSGLRQGTVELGGGGAPANQSQQQGYYNNNGNNGWIG